jgi:DNA-binding transcriptional MerR regulator
MPLNIVIHSPDDQEPLLYSRNDAARLARVSVSFWRLCEQEGLVHARRMVGGGKGYHPEDIERMAIIRRLHEDLELDMSSLEVVLQMRQRILELLDEVEDMELMARQRERELLAQLRALRQRLANEVD